MDGGSEKCAFVSGKLVIGLSWKRREIHGLGCYSLIGSGIRPVILERNH